MHFDGTITLGNLVTILGAMGSFVAVWVRVSYRLNALEKEQATQELAITELTKTGLVLMVNQHERRLADVERSLADIHEMKNDISWIKTTLTRKDS